MLSRKLIRTDLNLLVALQILLEERNVTRAAERLSVSQPALSKTLQKLRDSFEDELFTRTAHGLVPTPRAEALAKELPSLLEQVEHVLGDEAFDPETFVGCFKLLLPPILSEALLPGLMADLSETAPGVQIITAEVAPNFQEQLKRGRRISLPSSPWIPSATSSPSPSPPWLPAATCARTTRWRTKR